MTADEIDESGRGEKSLARTRQRKLKLWHVGIGLLCLAVAGLLIMRWHWRAQFQRRIEAIRAAGSPVTPQELDAWYPWPASGENAASWITGAATCLWKLTQEDGRCLERIVGRSDDRPRPGEPLGANLSELLERYIQTNSQALKLLHEAASVAECRYPIDLSQGLFAAMPHIADVRADCLLLCSEAILRAKEGDPNGATRAIEAGLRVACSLDHEPALLSHMVQMSTLSWAATSLEWALNAVAFPQEQLARLNRAFRSVHADDGLLRAIVGDRCLFLAVFEKPQLLSREHRFPKPPPAALLEMYGALGLAAREGTIFLDYMEECLRIAQLPAFQRPAAIKAEQARDRNSRKGMLWKLADVRDMPIIMMEHRRKHVAQLEMAKTLLALERHRLARASLPETLDQLVPDYLVAVPTDPFDGAPLRYQRSDRGFLVYSVGEDGQDDGGKPEPRKTEKPGETWDLVFRIERRG
jgi:hypothetical protein